MPREIHTETLNLTKATIPLILNRAALGSAEYVFAKMETIDGGPNYPAYVPRKAVTVKEQPLTGEEFQATLEVEILSDCGHYFLVETEAEGGTRVRFRLNKKQGRIEPFANRAMYKIS